MCWARKGDLLFFLFLLHSLTSPAEPSASGVERRDEAHEMEGTNKIFFVCTSLNSHEYLHCTCRH